MRGKHLLPASRHFFKGQNRCFPGALTTRFWNHLLLKELQAEVRSIFRILRTCSKRCYRERLPEQELFRHLWNIQTNWSVLRCSNKVVMDGRDPILTSMITGTRVSQTYQLWVPGAMFPCETKQWFSAVCVCKPSFSLPTHAGRSHNPGGAPAQIKIIQPIPFSKITWTKQTEIIWVHVELPNCHRHSLHNPR